MTNCHKKERPQSDKEVFMANKIVATNPTAKHNYIIEKTLDAGIVNWNINKIYTKWKD